MRRVIWTTTLATLALALPIVSLRAQGRQAGTPITTPGNAVAPPATSLILGRVVDADTGAPIEGVSVSIPASNPGPPVSTAAAPGTPRTPQPPRSVTTNGNGEFLFYGLTKGSYLIATTAPGYLPGQSGRRSLDDGGEPIALQQDEHLNGVVVRMWKYASISGTLLDESGEPAVGSQVRCARVSSRGDRRAYTPAGSAAADDRGHYRIVNITPGDYVVTVPQTTTTLPAATVDEYASRLSSGRPTTDLTRALTDSGAPFPSSSGLRLGDQMLLTLGGRGGSMTVATSGTRLAVALATYYPSTASVAEATVITLTSGQNRTGVDLQFRVQPAVSVSGHVVAPDGPAVNQGVRLLPASVATAGLDTGFEQAVTSTNGHGDFTFPAVPAGQYVLRSSRVPRAPAVITSMSFSSSSGGGSGISTVVSSGGASNTLPADPSLFAEQPLSVDRDVNNVQITLRPGSRVLGTLEFHGSSPAPAPDALQRVQVTLTRADRAGAFIPNTATQVTPDGQFTTSQYEPGEYFINASGPLGRYAVESVTRAGQNLDMLPIDLMSGDASGITIRLTDTPTTIGGSVSGGRSANATVGANTSSVPEIDGWVMAVPAAYTDWIAHGMAPRGARSISIDKQGRYRLSGLPPGDYIVAAVSAASAGSQRDAALFQAIARAGTHVALAAGETRTLDLTLSEIRR